MRKSIVLLSMIGAALLLSACGSSSAAKTVSVDEFAAQISKPDVTVIDVRHPDEFAAGHVDGAINIDVEGGDGVFDAGIAELDKSGAYALYCHSGRRSQIAADAMSAAGFTNVTNLKGGFADLAGAGLPVATGLPTS